MYQYQKILAANDIYSYRRYLQQILVMAGVLIFSLVNGSAFAAVGKPPSCPSSNDRMYYVGTGTTTATRQLLSTWTSGTTKKFEFDNGLELSFEFEKYIRNVSGYPKYIANDVNNTVGAIVMEHTSQKEDENHTLLSIINKPVTKYGFVVQDIDYLDSSAKYRETFKIVAPFDGVLSNTTTTFHTILNNKASAVAGSNCNASRDSNRCDINVNWQNKPANTIFKVSHGNDSPAVTNESGGNHAMGYSDFYFCLAPPTLTVKKALTGSRVNTTDQFEIKVTGGEIAANSFTTTGSNAEITTGTSALLNLKQSTTYTITEQVKNDSAVGDISKYNASYTCSNATTSSNTVMPSGTINSTGNTRSFDLINPQYGDEITCTITNTPKDYTFSGTVFNDNGGLSGKTSDDKNGTFISNTKYFNGKLDTGESGISGITYSDLKVSLTNCAGTNIGNTTAQTVSDTGKYSFTLPSSALNGINEVCIVQTKPNSWAYTVDTTPNKLQKTLVNDVYNYDNLNFGKVITDQTALVLKKYQYVHQCAANLSYTATTINGPDISSPSNGFSTNNASDVKPGQCIAYKIEAYNRGHIALTNIRITDILQKTPVESRFYLPVAAGIPATLRKTDQTASALINIGDNGVIITVPFELNNTAATTSASKATLYFNTKYGTTVDP